MGRGAGAGLGSHRHPAQGISGLSSCLSHSFLAWRGWSLWLPPSRLPPPLPALRPRQTPSRVRARSLNVWENALMQGSGSREPQWSCPSLPPCGRSAVLRARPPPRTLSVGQRGSQASPGAPPAPSRRAARVAGGRGDMAGLCREAPSLSRWRKF